MGHGVDDEAAGTEWTGRRLSERVLALPVTGRRLPAASLGGCLAVGDTLLVFLRHLG